LACSSFTPIGQLLQRLIVVSQCFRVFDVSTTANGSMHRIAAERCLQFLAGYA